MITIYVHCINKRIEYIFQHVFHNMLGTDYVLTDDVDAYSQAPGHCINYSSTNLNKGIWIYPHPLLSKTGISRQTIQIGRWEELPCFFLQSQGDIPFDLFAAAFYQLTRYEEYGCTELDKFGRFIGENSLAYKENFLQIPLVDRWVFRLKDLLLADGDAGDFNPRVFRLISTFDIDFPFRYRNKGLIKNLMSGVSDLLHKNLSGIKEMLLTQLHLQADPCMKALANIDALYKRHDKDYFLFIHVGQYGKYDRRTIYPLRRYYRYLRSLYNVRFGLHPSFHASFDAVLIRQEKQKLEKILGFSIARNRQHFLRMKMPHTYKSLNTLDFIEDFTLIYASLPGFRASTAIPFHFFDLQANEQTSLLIRPTIIMDTTFTSYLQLQPDEALENIKTLMQECMLSGGDFTMLWHPSTWTGLRGDAWYRIFTECFLYGISNQ
ncbi:MAG: hypothetical protein LBM08_12795 [Dysgonamonadaceae bacterium]|nr:hypothetical protein [Dysgonamonadaceae bacterium]